MKRILLASILYFFICVPASGKEPVRTISCLVTKVADGDTMTCLSDTARLKVRLYGIDAPETEKSNKRTRRISKPGQSYGDEAFQALSKNIVGRQVTLEVLNTDRYKRLVAIVRVGNRNINREMVRQGLAWAYRDYLDRPHASEYISAEYLARKERRGLWRQYNPVPPWEFRKQLKLIRHNTKNRTGSVNR